MEPPPLDPVDIVDEAEDAVVAEIVTGDARESRRRGRPPSGAIAMTLAERARRYRRRKTRSVRVEVFGSAFLQLEKAMLETGLSADAVVWHAIVATSDEFWCRFKATQ